MNENKYNRFVLALFCILVFGVLGVGMLLNYLSSGELQIVTVQVGGQYLLKEKTETKENYGLLLGYAQESINGSAFKNRKAKVSAYYYIPKDSSQAKVFDRLKEGDIILFTRDGNIALVLK